jgi:hemerythrin
VLCHPVFSFIFCFFKQYLNHGTREEGGRMAILTWNKHCLVGVKTLDGQHAGLIADLNQLYSAMSKGNAKCGADSQLRNLLKDALDHFSAEEELMEATEYPSLAQHRAKHRNFVRQVQEYLARCKEGDNTMRLPLLNFIRDWLTNHIQEEDREYAPWLIEHDLQ